jgi:hypothetical protein
MAWALGIGVASFAFRNVFYQGMSIGFAISLIIILWVLMDKRNWTRETFGSKFVYMPLIIISLSMIVAGFARYIDDRIFADLISRITLALYFFAIYLTSRVLGDKIFKPFAIAVVIESISVVFYSLILNYGIRNGGFASLYDYNPAVGLLLFGGVVSIFYKQWIIVTIALLGIFFTGAEEGILAVAVMFAAILIRRDFSKRILLPIVLIVVVIVLGVYPFNYTKKLYANPIDKATLILTGQHNTEALEVITVTQGEQPTSPEYYINTSDYVLNNRVNFLVEGLKNLKPLGSGYVMNPVDVKDKPIYNVPLVIMQQIGLLAALSWIFVTIYCLIKTRWRYAFIALIALGLLDNFVWCQLGVFWWCLVGVTTLSLRKNDFIFKDDICAV